MIAGRVREGRLFPVHRAVYAVGRPPRLPLERAAGAVLACGPGAALSHLGAKLLDPFLDGRNPTRSPFEDDLTAFCERHGLPRPLVNIPVAGHLVDALFTAERLIVELDSWEFHSDRQAFETDRERDADTMEAGYRTLRITWERPARARRRGSGSVAEDAQAADLTGRLQGDSGRSSSSPSSSMSTRSLKKHSSPAIRPTSARGSS